MIHNVLLVEDNGDDAVLLTHAFRKAAERVSLTTMPDGEAARSFLERSCRRGDRVRQPPPALVLLDLKLPRMSGLELLAWVREQPELRRLPIVILTSSRESVDVRRAYELGANSYLVKPVSLDDMQRLAGTLSLYWLELNEPAPLM